MLVVTKLSARALLWGLLARCKNCGSSTSVVNKDLYDIYGRCGWRQNVVFAHPFPPKENLKNKNKKPNMFLDPLLHDCAQLAYCAQRNSVGYSAEMEGVGCHANMC